MGRAHDGFLGQARKHTIERLLRMIVPAVPAQHEPSATPYLAPIPTVFWT